MPVLQVNDNAPDFILLDDEDNNVSLANFAGSRLVIYFYPKDDTPGCTMEAKGFSSLASAFNKLGTTIVGVSTDTTECHKKFKHKYGLNVRLLADVGQRMASSYGVWVEKSMFGKKYMGMERATFLLDNNHKIVKIWRNVKFLGHAEEVLRAVELLADTH